MYGQALENITLLQRRKLVPHPIPKSLSVIEIHNRLLCLQVLCVRFNKPSYILNYTYFIFNLLSGRARGWRMRLQRVVQVHHLLVYMI